MPPKNHARAVRYRQLSLAEADRGKADLLLTLADEAEVPFSARRQVLETALIRFGEASVCCLVQNLSDSGAALDMGPQTGIPDQFTLIVPRKTIYSCTAKENSLRCIVL